MTQADARRIAREAVLSILDKGRPTYADCAVAVADALYAAVQADAPACEQCGELEAIKFLVSDREEVGTYQKVEAAIAQASAVSADEIERQRLKDSFSSGIMPTIAPSAETVEQARPSADLVKWMRRKAQIIRDGVAQQNAMGGRFQLQYDDENYGSFARALEDGATALECADQEIAGLLAVRGSEPPQKKTCQHVQRHPYTPTSSVGDESDYTSRCVDCGKLFR